MKPEERRAKILALIEKKGRVEIHELSERFNVSKMTIRRDLKQLGNEGVVRRVRGGAVNSRGRSFEPALILRSRQNVEAKKAIALRAEKLINEGECIAVDVGSTAVELAKRLKGKQNLTVLTPSLQIASLLSNQNGLRIIVPGGIVRHGEGSMIGDLAIRAFEKLFVDKLFLGVGGIDPEAGFTEYNWDDTLVKRAMIESAKQIIILADSSKYDRVAFAAIAGLGDVDIIISNDQPPKKIKKQFEEMGVEIIIAE